MKNSKLFISVIAVLLFVFVAASSVFAASGSNGSITVTNTVSGKVYELYKILDLTYSGEANDNVAYTIADAWRAFFFNADGTKTDEGAKYLLDAQLTGEDAVKLNRITFDVKGDGTEYVQYYLNVTATNVPEFAQDALEYTTASNLTPTKTETATGEELKFTELALGYYLVYPKGATEIIEGNASLASLTSTLPNADIHVKSTYLNIEKEDYEDDKFETEESGNVYVGQTVYYEVTSTIPDTTAYTKGYTYEITDKLSAGLVSDFSDFKVFVDGTEVTLKNTDSLTIGTNEYKLVFDMTKYQEDKGKSLTIRYSATVTKDAVNSKTTSNELVLTYSNDPKDNTSKETITEKEYVYSSRVVVNKVLEDNKTPLAGAEFVLYKKDGNTKLYYKASNENGVINNTLSSAASTTAGLTNVEWVTNIADATHLITDINGEAIFNGLLDGTYFLKETAVPDGYNRLVNDKKVTVGFRGFDENQDTATFSVEENPGEFTVVIVNITGTELPETGGMGTTLFITVGTTLALVAGIVLVTNRRMAKERF